MKKLAVVLSAVLLMVVSWGSLVKAQDALPKLADLKAGWNEIAPGGETTCAYGDPYRFFVRPGTSDKLMIYFAGGGACWNGMFCSKDFKGQNGQPIFASQVPEGSSALLKDGLFDFTNADNPVADYNVVYVSYCTGDIHTGAKEVTYKDAKGNEFKIEHKGFIDAQAVLDWVYANFDKPSQVFIPGCSGGSYGSIFHAPYIMGHYKDTPMIQLGDAGVGVVVKGWDGLQTWGTQDNVPDSMKDLADVKPEDFGTALYRETGKAFPNNRFAQYTTWTDNTQIGFFFLQGGGKTGPEAGANWVKGMNRNLLSLEAQLPNFNAFIAGGGEHCITPTPNFYTYMANNVRFRDWVADLLSGKKVGNVLTVDTAKPQLYGVK